MKEDVNGARSTCLRYGFLCLWCHYSCFRCCCRAWWRREWIITRV